MRGMLRPKGRAVWLFAFATLAVSCSRPAGPRPQDSTQTDAGQVPFQNAANAPSDASRLSPVDPNKGSKAESALPFRDSQDLPAGTLVTVRLKEPISSDYPGERLTFGAVVDEAVQVDGNTLLARGASVAGRVESARTSQMKKDRGYVRLTLDAIDFGGRQLPVQTSSLFVHGNAANRSASETGAFSQVIHLESGRRLTFRLIEPVSTASVPLAGH
jgi:hypothetical protein